MRQPIICFEGPSGIGKTTIAQLFLQDDNIVPEVNLLFSRSSNEAEYWYLEKQVESYQMCMKSGRTSILDGDVFQPIWYNWVCNYPPEFISKAKSHDFYKDQLAKGGIEFPDLYIIFNATEKELRKRKEGDTTRQRRNFEKHLKIIEPMKGYWRFLDEETDVEIVFIDYKNLKDTQRQVKHLLDSFVVKKRKDIEEFKMIRRWINLDELS
jgi:thymidylate kinase